MTSQLLVFGPGYSATPVMMQAKEAGWHVFATYRDQEKQESLKASGYTPVSFDNGAAQIDTSAPLHILTSIAPPPGGDPVVETWGEWLSGLRGQVATITYLSSTNVYGDRAGAWVDETTAPKPTLERGKRRLLAEQQWENSADDIGARLFIFRLAGIYGPSRNAFQSLKSGRARCIIKKGQVFSRIHQQDIRDAIWLAINGEHKGGVFNLADDEPTPPHTVIETAATMMGMDTPTRENWETAQMSEMARSFYLESKRVRNDKVKKELGLTLNYPNYRQGLEALLPTGGD